MIRSEEIASNPFAQGERDGRALRIRTACRISESGRGSLPLPKVFNSKLVCGALSIRPQPPPTNSISRLHLELQPSRE